MSTDSIPREVALRLREVIYANCSCGGSGPDDVLACPACRIYHALDLSAYGDFAGPKTPPASSETVEVRIAVAANHKRQWGSCGFSDEKEQNLLRAVEHYGPAFWITARLPLPSPPKEIAGEVERQVEP